MPTYTRHIEKNFFFVNGILFFFFGGGFYLLFFFMAYLGPQTFKDKKVRIKNQQRAKTYPNPNNMISDFEVMDINPCIFGPSEVNNPDANLTKSS